MKQKFDSMKRSKKLTEEERKKEEGVRRWREREKGERRRTEKQKNYHYQALDRGYPYRP